ncbi:hypothetical protein MSSAC_0838 [Methanosarcina siciliae C2J]|uniref:Uncharacterized protein n=1 Tax=Methanosarcina siciliae C2J TaxID=1434118 RepID=A0A0E3PLW1_9EURY|nr:hypothetical protein [Methanosarcina siciliae]AKB35428.1 hypothetical protein MSSAC_0838 [Methanosarcina siciliae C2J]
MNRENTSQIPDRKRQQIEEHAQTIENVSFMRDVWQTGYMLDFNDENTIFLDFDKIGTATYYKKVYMVRLGGLPPSMTGEAWRYFVKLLKKKAVYGGKSK